MRVRAAICLVLSGCAAVTGLGDYELVDDPGGTIDASSGATADQHAPPSSTNPEGGGQNGTDGAAIDGAVEPGSDAGSDAGYAPSCTRTSCAGLASPSTCRSLACDQLDTWPVTKSGNGTFQLTNNQCVMRTGAVTASTAFVSNTVPGGSRYDFEFRLLVWEQGKDNNSGDVLLTIASGGTKITVEAGDNQDSVRLCVNGSCVGPVTVDGLLGADGKAVVFDVYGRWGDNESNGYVRMTAGTTNSVGAVVSCNQGLERPLLTPAQGKLTASVGCSYLRCDMTFDEVTFLQHPL